jgi:hypothetical protein
MLARDGLSVDHETLRRWLAAAGLWRGSRRRQAHRSRRERRAHAGELVQLDGSPHAWLEGRGPRCTLVEFVDDATGRAYGRLYAGETTEAVMDCLGRYVGRHGIPRSLYVDKAGIYVVNNREPTGAEILAGREPVTQFGRAAAELSMRVIPANSPQAKGRVERVHGTHQDRLVKPLRLEGVATMAAANDYLERRYWPDYNARFARPAANAADLHRRPPRGLDLAEVLCVKEARAVGRDWCVCYERRVLQVAARHQSLALAGREVEVRRYPDGRLSLWFRGRVLTHAELPGGRPAAPEKPRPVFTARAAYKPAADHPYRRRGLGAATRASAGLRGPSAAPQAPAALPG